ncbi:MAG: hypothetical protein RLY86_2350 [Pseudomonadota bacterium]|jgi:hypothetical protein
MAGANRSGIQHPDYASYHNLAKSITLRTLDAAADLVDITLRPQQENAQAGAIGNLIANGALRPDRSDLAQRFLDSVDNGSISVQRPKLLRLIYVEMSLYLAAIDYWDNEFCPDLATAMKENAKSYFVTVFGLATCCHRWRIIRTNAIPKHNELLGVQGLHVVTGAKADQEIAALLNPGSVNEAGPAMEVWESFRAMSTEAIRALPLLERMTEAADPFTKALVWLIAEAKRTP